MSYKAGQNDGGDARKPTLDNASARGNSSGKYGRLESQIKVACVAKENFIVVRI